MHLSRSSIHVCAVRSIRHPNLPFLNGALQLHAGLRECGQGTAPVQGQIHHDQIIQSFECGQVFLPPLVSAATTVGIDVDLFCATAGLANGFLIRLTHSTEVDGARQILAPERGFLFDAEPRPNDKASCCVQCKGQQAHHHAFVGFRRMARQGEGMVLIVLTVHVGDLHGRFENGRVRGHGVVVP